MTRYLYYYEHEDQDEDVRPVRPPWRAPALRALDAVGGDVLFAGALLTAVVLFGAKQVG